MPKSVFEGFVPKQHIEGQGVILRGSEIMQMQMASVAASYPGHYNIPRPQYRDRWGELTRQRKAMARSVHAICWRAGDEFEAMWRLYCKDGTRGQGLALRTTLRKLEQSVSQHDVIALQAINDSREGLAAGSRLKAAGARAAQEPARA